ncbi:MAG: hypothetical protein U9O98_03850 [Asgard group archaeon]|nr:hypothetical protein [Asgard group archaeon]
MSQKKDFIKPLELSTFSKPLLRKMGVKALLLVSFDIILGPIAYIANISREKSEYLEFLQNLAHLGEFYTGISHAQIEKVTTRTNEQMIVGRAIRKVDETKLIDIAVALIDKPDYEKELLKMLKFAVRTSYGDHENFGKLIDKVLLEYKSIGEKEDEQKGLPTPFKEIAEEKIQNIGKDFTHWFGVLFIDFESNKINSAFMPDWIMAQKINSQELANIIKKKYAGGEIVPRASQKYALISPKGKQLLVDTTSNMQYATVLYPTEKGMDKIPILAKTIDVLTDALAETSLNFNTQAMYETLKILDQNLNRQDTKKSLLKDVLVIMIRAGELKPRQTISTEKYLSLEGETQKKLFNNYSKVFKECQGNQTVLKISHKQNEPLEKVADFIVYGMSRGILQVFISNGRQRLPVVIKENVNYKK